MANLLWLQGGACSGNTMSFLNAEEPSACDLVTDFGINVLWQPSLGLELGDDVKAILEKCISGEIKLDIFVFEGTVIDAPNGTGEWNRFCNRPMKEWVKELSDAADFVVAIGDCATWGGIPANAPNPTDAKKKLGKTSRRSATARSSKRKPSSDRLPQWTRRSEGT